MTTAPTTPSGSLTLGLLRLAGRLFAAYWPVLCFWFLLQHLGHRLLLDASVRLGLFHRPLGFFGLAVLIVVQMICTIAMFQALRPGMPSLMRVSEGEGDDAGDAPASGAAAGATGLPGGTVATGARGAIRARSASRTRGSGRLTDAIAVALLPFFAYYATWGLLRDVVAQYSYEVLRNIAGLGLPGPQDIATAPALWISIVVTWIVRRLSLSRHKETGSPAWSILATICEAYWLFLGVLALSSWKQLPWDWWHRRAVYVAWQGWWVDPRDWLAPLKQLAGPLLSWVRDAVGVTILPLVWLAIAAIVYGHDLREPGSVKDADDHAHVARVRDRYGRLPPLLRQAVESWSDGFRKKATPVFNSLRLLLRAGLRPALALCVAYVTLDFVCSWAFRGAVLLIGPQERDIWNVILGPLSLVVGDQSGQSRSLLQEPLRICLLAAGIELTLREARRTEGADSAADATANAPTTIDGGASAFPVENAWPPRQSERGVNG